MEGLTCEACSGFPLVSVYLRVEYHNGSAVVRVGSGHTGHGARNLRSGKAGECRQHGFGSRGGALGVGLQRVFSRRSLLSEKQ